MKLRIAVLLAVFAGLLATTSLAQEAQSDYQVQQEFKTQYAEYEQQIEVVAKPDSAEQLIESIKEFDQRYTNHEELLDNVLYPETYDEKIEELKKSSVKALNRSKTITEQRQKLEEMETQLASYKDDLSELDQQTDSLKTAIQKSTKSEKELSGMVREYRERLEKRDELILTFIDSMVVTYQNMDIKALEDLENYDGKQRIKSNDALKLVHDITEENLNILQRNSADLQLEDYMRMAEVNYQFEQMWQKLGDKIREVYDGNNAETIASNIDRNIKKWNSQLSKHTVDALNKHFTQNDISIEEFASSDEFRTSLHDYLDSKIKQSKEDRSEANYEDLQQFKEFWSPVQIEWTNSLTYADVLSKDEMASLNQKVDTWTQEAQPRSNNILVYLLGGSVLLAVALGVMLIREKKNGRSA